MFERPRRGERALLVHIGIGATVDTEQVRELEELARSAGADVAGVVTGTRQSPDARFFAGTGKVDEIKEQVAADNVDLVIFDQPLNPSQERNLEKRLCCRVVDRTGLILDIFAQRARSFEGKLQVELAQLRHLSTRLVRGWTHLERQKGGIGLRGPGETQLETDRRLIGQRIRNLRRRLDKVDRQREQRRRTRRRGQVATVSLVGYTNAGKSTLFNQLTGANAYIADQLFATLDPTLRRLDLGNGEKVVLADTVGFVRELPHELIAAFRATLRESREAALLIHVVDAADERRGERIAEVEATLREIGAHDVPRLMVYNKCDLTDEAARVDRDARGEVRRVWVSALTGDGTSLLIETLAELLGNSAVHKVWRLPPEAARLRARLFEAGVVRAEHACPDGGWEVEIRIADRQLERICRDLHLDSEELSRYSCVPSGGYLQSGASGT